MFDKRRTQPSDPSDPATPSLETPQQPDAAAEDSSRLRKWLWGWRTLAMAAALVVVMQLVPYRVHNPAVVAEPNWDSPETRALTVRACFGCHSNETQKPWYAHVAPMAWLVNNHVEGGRSTLNFSEWTTGQARKADKINRVIRNGSMPPSSYTWFGLHSESKLTPAETDALLAGLQATIAASK